MGFFLLLHLLDSTLYQESTYYQLFLYFVSILMSPFLLLKHIQTGLGAVFFSPFHFHFFSFILPLYFSFNFFHTYPFLFLFLHVFLYTQFSLCTLIIATHNLGNLPKLWCVESNEDQVQYKLIISEIGK